MLKSIKSKLLVFILLLSVVPMLVMNIYQLSNYSNDQKKEIVTHLKDIARDKADAINLWLEENKDLLKTICDNYPGINTSNLENVVPTLKNIVQQYPNIDNALLVDEKGDSISDKGQKINIADREYFEKAKKSDSILISDIVTSRGTGKNVIAFILPIRDDNSEFKGLFVVSVNAEKVLKIISDIKEGQTGYGYLINKDSTRFITHPTKEYIGKKYSEVNPDNFSLFKQTVFKDNYGEVKYIAYDKSERLGYYELIEAANWQLVVTGKTSEILLEVNKAVRITEIWIFISIIVIISLGILFGTWFTKPIKKVTELLVKTEQLDLTSDNSIEELFQYKDETAVMAKALASTRKTMGDLIGKIQKSSLTVEDNTKLLSCTLGETVSSIEGVARVIDDMAKGSVELAKNTQLSVEKLDMLSKKIENINSTSMQMKDFTDESKKAKDNGLEVVNKLQRVVVDNEKVAVRVSEKVYFLDEKAQKIGVITETIKNITNQINLLSLNASIEAARAGEAGKGFSIVADEIKKLASHTAASTVEIDNIIGEFKNTIEDTKKEMVAAKEVIGNTSIMSKATGEAFESIDKSVANIIDKINSLATDIAVMSKDKEEVVKAIEDISSVSEQSASTIEEISASTEEQVASMEQIAGSSEALCKIAEEMKELTTKFKVN